MTSDRGFNLIRDVWLPVRCASGNVEIRRISGLTQSDNPAIEPAWGRADLDAATLEFLIGILAIAIPPSERRVWLDYWRVAPGPETLDAALVPLARWFDLDGDGPRFLQDRESLEGKTNPIEALFIDAPGEQGRNLNKDLFEKRDRIRVLSRPAAAIALFALQSCSPAGGSGHRTSLRGGGPLSTLVVPGRSADRKPVSLWRGLWTNVPQGSVACDNELPCILPWASPTRTSDKAGGQTTPQDVDERQQFFGMPRRIRLVFEPNTEGRPCDITGRVDPVIVTGFVMRPHGPQYKAFRHPLTPHNVKKGLAVPVPAPDGRIGYRLWLGLVHRTADGKRLPADCVNTFFKERAADLGSLDKPAKRDSRLVCAGYAMDKMKPLAFVEAEMPLHALADDAANASLASLAARLIGGTDAVARLVAGAVKFALFGKKSKVKFNSTALSNAREAIWDETEAMFYDRLREVADMLEQNVAADFETIVCGWRDTLQEVALGVFDRQVPLTDVGVLNPARIVEARRDLVWSLRGYGKAGGDIFTKLQRAPPEQRKSANAHRAASGTEAPP
jgi:CRISPR system Cascade subunit CasA